MQRPRRQHLPSLRDSRLRVGESVPGTCVPGYHLLSLRDSVDSTAFATRDTSGLLNYSKTCVEPVGGKPPTERGGYTQRTVSLLPVG